jgi:arylsulfatase A
MKFILLLPLLIGSVSLFSKPPNVVLLFADDLGTLDLNCYGSSDLHTPNLDLLARQGVRFTQAYAHSVCCPARAMLLTGRYPQRGGINTWTQGNMYDNKGANLALSEYTMAEMLKEEGYQTGIFGKWHLGAHINHGPTKQGFDYFWGHRGGFIDNYNHYFLHGEGFHDLYEGTREVMDHAGQYFPDMMTRRAVDFIKKNKKKPFFAYCSFNLPHYPEQADRKFDQTYKDMQNPQRQAYAKVVSTMDDRIGWIINTLEELDLRKNTILIFMSDNGHSTERNHIKVDNHKSGLTKGTPYGANGGGGNTGKWKGAKFTYFEGGLRVPSIISWPSKVPENEVRNQPITAMDWLPTIRTMTNATLPANLSLDGYDLSDIIRSPDEPSKYTPIHWMFGQSWAVLEGNWKLVGRGKDPHFLGNLNDPKPEQINYLTQESVLVGRLHTLHQKWEKKVQPVSR